MVELTDASGIVFPDVIESLYLNSVKSAKGLSLPKLIVKKCVLTGLTSLDDLILPQNMNLENLYLSKNLKEEFNMIIQSHCESGKA